MRYFDCVCVRDEREKESGVRWNKKFRLINVAWNSFRSNRNCVLFFSSTWWCRRCRLCCNHAMLFVHWNGWCSEYFTFWIINFKKPIDLLPLDIAFALCTLSTAQFYMGERKLQILYTCVAYTSCIDCDGVSLNAKKMIYV